MNRIAALVMPLIVLGLTPSPGHAWTKKCMWPHAGYTEIDVLVNCASFEAHGYPCAVVREAAAMGAKPWNTTGGSLVRLKEPASTTKWHSESGEIVIKMIPADHFNPAIIARAAYGCGGTAVINLHASGSYAPGVYPFEPRSAGSANRVNVYNDMVGVFAHEFGHNLGLKHPEDSAVEGDCGQGGSTNMHALMGYRHEPRTLFRDDYDALWSGNTSCAYVRAPPPDPQTRTIRLAVSGDQGQSWWQLHEWSSFYPAGGNLSPGMARTPTGLLMAIPTLDNYIATYWYNGNVISSNVWQNRALAGPAVAYGGGTYLIAYPELGTLSIGRMLFLRSTDGSSWNASTGATTGNRPALAWHEGTQRFYMAITEHPGYSGNPYWPHRVQIWSSATGATWQGPYTADEGNTQEEGLMLGDFASAGPGLVCPPLEEDCWLVYPDARSYPGTLRVRRITPCAGVEDPLPSCASAGEVVPTGFGYPWQLPAWGAGGFLPLPSTTREDVALAHDPTANAIIVALRGTTAMKEGRVLWFGMNDTHPPPGFGGDPPYSGYLHGGIAFTQMHSGPALAVEPYFEGHVVYALGHSAPLD
jgi:hypothetical protein